MSRNLTPIIGKKSFFFLVGMLLLVLPNFVIPRVATLNPAIHSKTLMLRWILGAMLLAAALASFRFSRHRLRAGEVALLVFVFANFISAIMSSTPGFSLTDSWQIWVLPLASVGIVRLSPTLDERHKFVHLAVAGGVIAAAYGLCVYFGYDFLRALYPFAYSKGDARNYIHSFLGNPEYFGGYMAPLAVLAFGYALCEWHSLLRRILWLSLCTFFLLALVLSGTRGALLGTLFGGTMILWRVYRVQDPAARRRIMAGIVFLGLVAAAAVTVLSVPNPLNVRRMRLAQRFVSAFDLASDSVRERILFFATASRIVKDHPWLGVGPGCFKLHFYPTVRRLVEEDDRAGFRHFAETLQGRVAEHAHNDYLEFLSELGVLGFAAYAGVVSVLISRFRARRIVTTDFGKIPSNRQAWFQFTILFGALACLLLNALFSFPLHLPVRASLFWILVGLFLSSDYELDSVSVLDIGGHFCHVDTSAENS